MNMAEAVRSVLSQYATFSGRAVRSEFWWWVLFTIIVGAVLNGIEALVGWQDWGPLSGLFGLATLIPNLAVSARRLHDTDRTGWWLLMLLVPVVGWLVLLWFYVQPGSEGVNRFG